MAMDIMDIMRLAEVTTLGKRLRNVRGIRLRTTGNLSR